MGPTRLRTSCSLLKEVIAPNPWVCRVKSRSLDLIKDFEIVAVLNRGDFFGEIALTFNSIRSYTVETYQYTSLGALNQKDFDQLCLMFPFFLEALEKRTANYNDDRHVFLE